MSSISAGSTSGLRREERVDDLGGEVLGADVPEHAALRAAHRGADGVDDDRLLSWHHSPWKPRPDPARVGELLRGRVEGARAPRASPRPSGAPGRRSRRPSGRSRPGTAGSRGRRGGRCRPRPAVATIPSSRQREHSRSIGSIIRSTICLVGDLGRRPWRGPSASAFASGSLCLLRRALLLAASRRRSPCRSSGRGARPRPSPRWRSRPSWRIRSGKASAITLSAWTQVSIPTTSMRSAGPIGQPHFSITLSIRS